MSHFGMEEDRLWREKNTPSGFLFKKKKNHKNKCKPNHTVKDYPKG